LFIRLDFRVRNALMRGTVIDCETDGLSPLNDNIVTLGVLRGGWGSVYQLIKTDYERFRKACLRVVRRCQKPLYAYAAHFEARFLGMEGAWVDLMRSGRTRLSAVTKEPFPGIGEISGSDVPLFWMRWLRTRNPRTLFEISWHCCVDLLRTAQLV